MPRSLTHAAAVVLACTAWAMPGGSHARAAEAIRIVVPFPPGGPTDILVRVLADQVARAGKATFVIENRPGAGGEIGTEAVARAAPDGRTLLVTSNAFVIDPHLHKVSYDPIASFAPICELAETPMLLVINDASPYRVLADFIVAARTAPGQLTLAGTGPATAVQIAFEKLKREASADITFVPYAGAAPAVNALLGAHVTAALVPYVVVAEHLKAGKLRALATVSRRRTDPLPELPTVAEAGYQGIEAELWTGLVAPARTPRGLLRQLDDWFAAVLKVPEIKTRLAAQGQYPVGICGDEFAALIRDQYEENGRVIRAGNIKPE